MKRASDLANPKRNWNKTPGYTEAETSAFAHVLDPSAPLPCSSSQSSSDKEAADAATPPEYASAGKFVDVWRAHHPNTRHYTYFSYRFNARIKGLGWRLDMCTSPHASFWHELTIILCDDEQLC